MATLEEQREGGEKVSREEIKQVVVKEQDLSAHRVQALELRPPMSQRPNAELPHGKTFASSTYDGEGEEASLHQPEQAERSSSWADAEGAEHLALGLKDGAGRHASECPREPKPSGGFRRRSPDRQRNFVFLRRSHSSEPRKDLRACVQRMWCRYHRSLGRNRTVGCRQKHDFQTYGNGVPEGRERPFLVGPLGYSQWDPGGHIGR